jgi:tetratricopeptide (TPR) repeat protein
MARSTPRLHSTRQPTPRLRTTRLCTSRLRRAALALLGAWLLTALACSSQQEQALSALHYFQKGNAAYQAEDYRRAIEHYQMALKFDDASPDVYYNLGLAYYRVSAYDDAVKAYQQALKLDPAFADAHLNVALAYDKLYNAAAANLHYNRYRTLVTGENEQAAAAAAPMGNPVAPSANTAMALPAGAGAGQARPATVKLPAGFNPSAVGALQPATAPGPGGRARPATSLVVPQGTRPGAVPPAAGLQEATQAPPPNPFEGNTKWWTQDAASQSR